MSKIYYLAFVCFLLLSLLGCTSSQQEHPLDEVRSQDSYFDSYTKLTLLTLSEGDGEKKEFAFEKDGNIISAISDVDTIYYIVNHLGDEKNVDFEDIVSYFGDEGTYLILDLDRNDGTIYKLGIYVP